MFAQQVTYFGAFVGGLLSFLSPCILPLIPSYLAFISGVSLLDAQSGKVSRASIFIPALFFVAGFTTVFMGLGATATTVGKFLLTHSKLFSQIGGALVILFGLVTCHIIDLPFLKYEKRIQVSKKPIGILGAFLVGVVFAFGWSPCVGPILASILTIAAQQETVAQGMKLLALYSAGLAIPFLVVSLALEPFFKLLAKLRKYMEVVELVSGKLLIAMGMMLFLGTFGSVTEVMGEVTLLSASIFITFTTVAVTQIWILVSFVDWLHDKGISEIPWSGRLLFLLDLLSIALLQVINTFKQYTPE